MRLLEKERRKRQHSNQGEIRIFALWLGPRLWLRINARFRLGSGFGTSLVCAGATGLPLEG